MSLRACSVERVTTLEARNSVPAPASAYRAALDVLFSIRAGVPGGRLESAAACDI